MLALLGALTLTLAALPGTEITDEVIIVMQAPSEPTHVSDRRPEVVPPKRGETARRWFDHPEQTYLDSDVGPVALYIDPVFDGAGNPTPKFPSPYAKQMFDDPSEESARTYLEANKVRVRRLKEVMAIVERTSVKYGYVVPEDFERKVKDSPNFDAYGVMPIQSANKNDWGDPILSVEQARLIGMDSFNIPISPRSAGKFEVWYLWDRRVPESVEGMKDFVTFAVSLQDLEARIRTKTINLDNDKPKHIAYVDYVDGQLNIPMKRLENYTDYTNLRASMAVQWVPTYVFVDQRRGKVERLEGARTLAELQQAMLAFLDKPRQAWAPTPEWFLDDASLVALQKENKEQTLTAPAASAPPQAGATLPPSQAILPWKPARGN